MLVCVHVCAHVCVHVCASCACVHVCVRVRACVCTCVCTHVFVCSFSHSVMTLYTLCNTMDCSLPGSSVRGIFQARILEWVAISYSSGSYQSRDRTHISCTDTLPLSHQGSLRALLMPILEVISILEMINTGSDLRSSLGCAYRLQAATYPWV